MLPRTQINAYMIYPCLNRYPIYSGGIYSINILCILNSQGKQSLNSPYSVIIVLASWIHHQSVITFYMSLRICADETSKNDNCWQVHWRIVTVKNFQQLPIGRAGHRPIISGWNDGTWRVHHPPKPRSVQGFSKTWVELNTSGLE